MFTELCKERMPGNSIFHMVDESLIKDTIQAGHLQRITIRRLLLMIESAYMSGAEAVLITCSSIGPGVAIAQQIFDFPVIRVDEAMAEKAVQMGPKIGVIATLRTTLEPTIALLNEKAVAAGGDVAIVDSLCDGAFEAVLSGDTATHDRIVSNALMEMMEKADVIVLAQASMSRVVKTLPRGSLKVPVLSSPELAVIRAREILSELKDKPSHREFGV